MSVVMFTREEESRLVLLAKSGSEEAICRLMERFQPLMSAAVSKYTRGFHHQHTEEDLNSEARTAFLESVRDFNPQRNTRFATLLRLALRRRIIDEIRRLNRYDSRVVSELEPNTADRCFGEEGTPDEIDLPDMLVRLSEVMKTLSEPDRALLTLRFIERKSREEIISSGLTGCVSLDQVSSRTAELLRSMRQELEK
jgi:RNA polymerase sigma factor (sigma-70 family)